MTFILLSKFTRPDVLNKLAVQQQVKRDKWAPARARTHASALVPAKCRGSSDGDGDDGGNANARPLNPCL